MSKHDDAPILFLPRQIRRKPFQLGGADACTGIRDVVQRDEMNAFMIEGIIRLAEKFLEGSAIVQRSIMLAGNEPQVSYLQSANDVAELRQALAALLWVVRGMGQIAGKDDEIGLRLQRVD